MEFTRKKFLKLNEMQRHKKCAELLKKAYLEGAQDLETYNTLLRFIHLNPYTNVDPKALADRYHWHLQKAGLSLKEHNLLPKLRTNDRSEAKRPFGKVAVYLDHVRSAYNVGSILRTLEALRLGELHFSKDTPFIDNEKVQKTAMGAAGIVPCFQNSDLEKLPRPFIALDTSNSAVAVSEFSFPESFTLILGNEEYGISEKSLSLVDYIVEIPLFGIKNSINIACAFSIAAAAILKR